MKHRKLSRLIDPALVMLFLVAGGCAASWTNVSSESYTYPMTITPAATACHIHSGLKANIKVTSLAKAVELDPKLLPGTVWPISIGGQGAWEGQGDISHCDVGTNRT